MAAENDQNSEYSSESDGSKEEKAEMQKKLEFEHTDDKSMTSSE